MADVFAFESTAYPQNSVSQNDVLDPLNSLFKEAKVDILESVIDQVYRIGYRYLDAASNNYCTSIIIRFITFRHRTVLYRAKNKLMRDVRIKLDLTKSRYGFIKESERSCERGTFY